MIYYFAYGSNLHPLRLMERISTVELVSSVAISRHRLEFHKRGQDGSGKCNIVVTNDRSDVVHGVIYKIQKHQKIILDKYEGKGAGYNDQTISVQHNDKEYTCLTYIADIEYVDDSLKPFHWYKELVLHGASHFNFPETYIKAIESLDSIADPDAERMKIHETLIDSLKQRQDD